jgi:hypothetical protein
MESGVRHLDWLSHLLTHPIEVGPIRTTNQDKIRTIAVGSAKDQRLHDLSKFASDRISRLLRGTRALWQFNDLE